MDVKSVNFTSKIRFVNRDEYWKIAKHNRIYPSHGISGVLKADSFFSEGIKTCSGGGIVSPFVEALGFHFKDDLMNDSNFLQLSNSIFNVIKNPQRALLVGSKELDENPYSRKQFLKLKKLFKKHIKNCSFFENHRYENSQTHYHYSLADDTWTLFSEYRFSDNDRSICVKDLKTLKKCFKKISIAKGDKLFVGDREILVKDAPEIFQ